MADLMQFLHFLHIQVIRQGCISLAGITDKIICEFVDPLVLQPASLDVATVKKKPEEDLVLLNSHSITNGTDGIDLWIQASFDASLRSRLDSLRQLIF